ncbi:macro domain-containing protein [Mesorhizobium sp. C386A]|uniref:macro domain-containing protein n=1 Tax=Mesorhizobium sp. C386A TaxID=2956831 RepID=UPI00333BFF91
MLGPAGLLGVISGHWSQTAISRASFIWQPSQICITPLPYLRKAVRGLVKWADKNRVESIALPKIGSGLGKLSWLDEVKPLLMEQLPPGPTRYVVYETFLNEFENSAPPRLK